MRKTMERGFFGGISVGIGVALADAVFASLASAGFLAATDFLEKYNVYVKIIGSLIILLLGYKELKGMPLSGKSTLRGNQKSLILLTIQAFFLTLMNPMTVILFGGVFASIAHTDVTLLESLFIIAGISSGSICWWITLSFIAKKTRGKISPRTIQRIQMTCAYLLLILGSYGLISGLITFFKN